jgi:uncharacterized protein YybS (DUF2232 family)
MENLLYFLISFGLMALFFFVMAFIFLFMLRKNNKWTAVIAAGFIYCFAVFGGMYAFAKISTGQDMIKYSFDEMQKNTDRALEEAGKKGASPEEIALARKSLEMMVIKPFAGWVVISTAFIIFLVYFIIRLYALNRYGIADGMPPFELWRIAEPVMWLLIACMSALVFKKMINNPLVDSIAYNLLFVLAAVYFTAGLSVVSYLFIKYKVPWPAKFFFYLMLVLWSFLGIIIILNGMLDTWFNFRKLEKGGLTWK